MNGRAAPSTVRLCAWSVVPGRSVRLVYWLVPHSRISSSRSETASRYPCHSPSAYSSSPASGFHCSAPFTDGRTRSPAP